jgi:glycosyltransferase involved in cell wall biosynthesis
LSELGVSAEEKGKSKRMLRHVLYLSYDGLTDPLGASQILPYVLGLEEKGYRFTLVSFEKKERFDEGKESIFRRIQHRKINWKPLSYTAKPPVLSTLWDIHRLKKTVRSIHQEDSVNLVHCRSYITALAGLELKRQFGIPFLFDMRGFYPDERADAGMWPKNHPLFGFVYRFFKKKEVAFLQEADHTVVLTHAGEAIMREGKLTGHPFAGPLSVIPCCADFSFFDYRRISERDKKAFRAQAEIPAEAFVLGYSGSLGTWYMLPQMMDFFAVFLKTKPGAVFVFLTRDEPAAVFREALRAGVPKGSVRVRSCSREEMPLGVSLFDASLFFILPSFSKQASSPTKQGELMGMGVPVMCNSLVGDVRKIVEDNDSGIVVEGFTETDYVEAVNHFFEKTFDKEKIRREGELFYGLSEGVARYLAVYESLLPTLL